MISKAFQFLPWCIRFYCGLLSIDRVSYLLHYSLWAYITWSTAPSITRFGLCALLELISVSCLAMHSCWVWFIQMMYQMQIIYYDRRTWWDEISDMRLNMLRLVWEATVGCGFSSPMLATTRTWVLAFGTKTSVQPHGAWTTSWLTNLPSRFHESHSSGVPFDICIENLLKDLPGAGAFITGR